MFAVLNRMSHVCFLIVMLKASKHVVTSCRAQDLESSARSDSFRMFGRRRGGSGQHGGVVFKLKAVFSVSNNQGDPKVEKALGEAERKDVKDHVRAHSVG